MSFAALLILAAVSEPIPKQLGYPVFVRGEGAQCAYQIQDMVMHEDRQVRDWMRKISTLYRVDIVVGANSPSECVAKVRSVIETSGHSDIVVREGSEADYGPLGP